jgi:hypothetical protein
MFFSLAPGNGGDGWGEELRPRNDMVAADAAWTEPSKARRRRAQPRSRVDVNTCTGIMRQCTGKKSPSLG